ncbi:MAG: 3-deoxy-7-phosphoheptulonate synthase class II [Balneolaceae bacterium]
MAIDSIPIKRSKRLEESEWHPLSWNDRKVNQLPTYPDPKHLQKVYDELRNLPPLVTSWEVEALREKLTQVGRRKSFLLQGGDCAETFDGCNAPKIVNLLKVMLQMSFILVHEMGVPVVRLGRVAGQYAKPRSKDTEVVNGVEMLNYRGDLINSFEADKEARMPDPERLQMAYNKAALTLNFLRALSDEGFADLQHPEQWELDFMKNNPYYKEYEQMVHSINKAVGFMEAITPENRINSLHKVDLYTSHEALNLYYEAAQTRRVPRKEGWFNLSAHLVWLGNRTRGLENAHVEYLRGIRNPVGIKVGPPIEKDDFLKLLDRINPEREEGKIVLISRFGIKEVEKDMPELIRAVDREGHPVVWTCDPMHGNTFATSDNIKTRNFNDILDELKATFQIHRAEGSYLGGVHLELTGDNVTECVGGSKGLSEDGLKRNYETYCDPRLNYEQSLEMAFLVSREWNSSHRS